MAATRIDPAPDLSAEDVEWIYGEVLGRAARQDEIDHQLANAHDLRDLLVGVFASPEHQARRDGATAAQGAAATAAFVDDLRLLNDTLAAAGFAGRYWVFAGLLIGFAREGWVLAHDSADADFCVRSSDLPAFLDTFPALRAAGFEPLFRFHTNAGAVTEFSFTKGGAKFEFFLLDAADGRLSYYDMADGQRGDAPTQARASIAEQPLVAFEFLGRTWHKHADHDAELTEMYGDWRTPDPGWDYMDDHAIVEREPWTRGGEIPWDGRVDDLAEIAGR